MNNEVAGIDFLQYEGEERATSFSSTIVVSTSSAITIIAMVDVAIVGSI
jgi:hypothetical protein